MTKTIEVSAAQYEDYDDCLAAAAADYVRDHPEARGYDLSPRWADDDDRSVILLDAPERRGGRGGGSGAL